MAAIKVTTGGKEYMPQATKLLARAFREDPVIIYMLCNLSDEQRLAYMETWFRCLMAAATLNKGTIEEANDWASVCVWMPPGEKVDNPWRFLQAGWLNVLWNLGIKGCKRMLIGFQAQANAAKARELKGRKYHYLFFVATEEEHRGKGLAAALIQRQQEAVINNNPLPIWLEATTQASMRLYSKLGFKIVQEIVIGKGEAGADGKKKDGGEGVTVWAMVWEPKSESSLSST